MTSNIASSHLMCRVGNRLCAIPVSQAIEIMRPQALEALPSAPGFVLGLSLIRGLPTPVVDAGLLLGGAPAEPSRIVTVRTGDRHVGVAVDEVIGVRNLPADALSHSPPLAEAALSGAIATIGRLDRELLVVLESARLVPEAVWGAMDEAHP